MMRRSVVGVQPGGAGRIDLRQPGVQGGAAEALGLFGQALPQVGVGGRAVEQAVQQRLEVERRAADEQRRACRGPRSRGTHSAAPLQPPGHARRLPRVEHVDQVVRHPAALVGVRLGRADVHAAIQRHRVHRHDLRAEALGQLDAEGRFARAGRAGEDQGIAEGVGSHGAHLAVRAQTINQ